MDALRTTLDRLTRRGGPLPPPQVLVRTPEWEFTYGDVEQPFHAASCGKLVTAALVAMLAERGRLDLDAPLGAVLPVDDTAGLPAAPGVDVARDVTVEHLLTHTSGLPDYFEPPRGYATDASVHGVTVHRDRRWTPRELLHESHRLPPAGRPGERFLYSDTNYVLLGRIAEEAGKDTLATLVRTEIFEPCGMDRSSTPYDSTVIPDDLSGLDVAPFWIGGHELSRAHGVSLDWAGGGVVAPPADWVRFQQALHGGRLVSAATLARLTRSRHRFRRGLHYGAGTMTIRFHEFVPILLRGLPRPVGHLGYLAAHTFYYPEQDAHVVLNFHSHSRMNASFTIHSRIARLIAGGGR